jgi:hypothetical protein
MRMTVLRTVILILSSVSPPRLPDAIPVPGSKKTRMVRLCRHRFAQSHQHFEKIVDLVLAAKVVTSMRPHLTADVD